jgi:hypothetical protein
MRQHYEKLREKLLQPKGNHLGMDKTIFSLSHHQSDLASSPWVYSLVDLERKEPSDLQLLLNDLTTNMVQNPLQHQGNNQFTPLDGSRFVFLDQCEDHY